MLPDLNFVNKNEFNFFLGYRGRLYRAGSWENTGFSSITSSLLTQFSPYLLPVSLEDGLGTLLGCPDSGWPVLVGVMRGRQNSYLHLFSLFLYLKVSIQDSHKAAAHGTLLFLPFVHSQSL